MVRLLRDFLVVVVLGIAGTNQAQVAESADAPVAISVRAEFEGDMLHLGGGASVPDGAWIIYAAYRVAEPQRRVTGYTEIRDERFTAQANVSGWPLGEIAVDAHFQVRLPEREQPEAVITRFGQNGERMRGDDVVQGGGGFRAAIASTTVLKSR